MPFRTPAPVFCLLFAAGSAFSQPVPMPVISVAMFRVQPDRMERFVDIIRLITPSLDRLVQAGTIDAYGLDSDMLHTEGPNAALWYTSRNFAGISEAEKAVQAALQANSEKMKDAYTVTDFAQHRDLMFRSLESGAGKTPPGALPVTFFQQEKVKPGKLAAARMLFRHHEKPVLDQLIQDGVIYAYSMHVEAIHTMEPGTVMYLITAPDLAAMDKIRAAFQAARAKVPDLERQAVEAIEEDVFDRKAHRDFVMRALIFRAR